MKTGLQMLIEENDKKELDVSVESREVLKRIMKYFSSSQLSLTTIQSIRKDLIGMALEAEGRGERLEDAIGEDLQVFCDSILVNATKDKNEYWLRTASLWLWSAFLLFIMDWGIINPFPQVYGAKAPFVFYFLYCFAVWLPFDYFERKFLFDKKKIARLYSVRVITIIILFRISDLLLPNVLFYINGWLTATMLLIAAIAVQIAKRSYITKYAGQK